jgi:ADP-ribose pyrophosphatase YjhB (NUDIX family)
MATVDEIRKFFTEGHREYRPNVTIDCVIFGYQAGELKVLLVKNKLQTMWCLPGGYIKKTETLDEAASRITQDRTGMAKLFFQQFKAFGNPNRNEDNSVDLSLVTELAGVDASSFGWLAGPTITIGYYAITDIVQARPAPDIFSSECDWFPIHQLPKLGFDHDELVKEALFTMRIHLYHFPIGKNLLPAKFTLREIKEFYEAMSGKELNASNFPNKLISIGLIRKTNEKRKIGAHRSPTFYTFDKKAYEKALKEGLVLA